MTHPVIPAALFALIVYPMAVARFTRMTNFDAILDRPRVALVRLVRGNPVVVYFITCPWCVSIWVAFATAWVPIYFATNPAAQMIGIALAASHFTGLQAPLVKDDDFKIDEPDDEQDDQ